MISKTEKVLKKLFYAGEEGVFSFDLLPVGGLRYAARIQDLKNKGISIISKAEKRGDSTGCRYYLVES